MKQIHLRLASPGHIQAELTHFKIKSKLDKLDQIARSISKFIIRGNR